MKPSLVIVASVALLGCSGVGGTGISQWLSEHQITISEVSSWPTVPANAITAKSNNCATATDLCDGILPEALCSLFCANISETDTCCARDYPTGPTPASICLQSCCENTCTSPPTAAPTDQPAPSTTTPTGVGETFAPTPAPAPTPSPSSSPTVAPTPAPTESPTPGWPVNEYGSGDDTGVTGVTTTAAYTFSDIVFAGLTEAQRSAVRHAVKLAYLSGLPTFPEWAVIGVYLVPVRDRPGRRRRTLGTVAYVVVAATTGPLPLISFAVDQLPPQTNVPGVQLLDLPNVFPSAAPTTAPVTVAPTAPLTAAPTDSPAQSGDSASTTEEDDNFIAFLGREENRWILIVVSLALVFLCCCLVGGKDSTQHASQKALRPPAMTASNSAFNVSASTAASAESNAFFTGSNAPAQATGGSDVRDARPGGVRGSSIRQKLALFGDGPTQSREQVTWVEEPQSPPRSPPSHYYPGASLTSHPTASVGAGLVPTQRMFLPLSPVTERPDLATGRPTDLVVNPLFPEIDNGISPPVADKAAARVQVTTQNTKPRTANQAKADHAAAVASAMNLDNVHLESATAVVGLLKNYRVTPLQLLRLLELRLKDIDADGVCAVPITCFDRARRRAADLKFPETPPPGYLYGLPVLIKDEIPVEGARWVNGSVLFTDRVASDSDPLVLKIEAMGGIVYGKSNTPEFCAGSHSFNPVFPTTKSPHDLRVSAGGSSGGSAAALASCTAWLATGSDLGGSLRIPAAFCGVVGFRCTPGRVPTAASLARSAENALRADSCRFLHAVNGPMARNCADLALLLDVMTADDVVGPAASPGAGIPALPALKAASWSAAVSSAAVAATGAGWHGKKVCFSELGCKTNPAATKICERAAGLLGTVTEQVAPFDLSAAEKVFHVFRAALFHDSFKLYSQAERAAMKPEIQWNYNCYANNAVGAEVLLEEAQVGSEQLAAEVDALFEKFDLLVTPATLDVPFDANLRYPTGDYGRLTAGDPPMTSYLDWMMPACLVSATSCPAIVLPVGTVGPDDLPVGLQIIGPVGADEEVLAAAAALEAALMAMGPANGGIGSVPPCPTPKRGTSGLRGSGPRTESEAADHHQGGVERFVATFWSGDGAATTVPERSWYN